MSSGKMGALVIMIAIIGALFGSWAMSMDVNENEVTKYKSLADMTGEFQSEPVPEYTKFNPSTNYTGYFTQDSIFGEDRYFDGVKFTQSNPNNYRLNLKPLESVDNVSLDLSALTSDSGNWDMIYWDSDRDDHTWDTRHLSIPNLLSLLQITPDSLTMVSDFTSYDDGGWFTFVTKDMVRNPTVSSEASPDKWILMKDPSITSGNLVHYISGVPQALQPKYKASDVNNPILAAKYNGLSRTVELFYDVDMQNSAGVFSPNDVYIIWSNSTSSSIHLGHSGTYSYYQLPPPEYMDPSKGVELN